MLSNFQLGDRALLQSFLVGQPELRNMMQSPQMKQLRQRVIASYHLGPLDKGETRGYIEHRLHLAGPADAGGRQVEDGADRTVADFVCPENGHVAADDLDSFEDVPKSPQVRRRTDDGDNTPSVG